MYTSFFGLNENPFSITPNPRYLYMSERHTEALAHLIYGIKDASGFVQLTGEVGTGKTTLIRSLLQRIPRNADVALVLNPQLSATEFLTSVLAELGIPLPADTSSKKALIDALNRFLLENHSRGRRTILIVDEAQNFAVDVLEQIRLLTNLETTKQKLFQITLIGQPELREMLDRNDLRQLAQRITGRYHLQPLNQSETEEYIRHRLRIAGASRDIFTKSASKEMYRLSGGVPRIINVIADRALLGAYTQEAQEITPAMVRRAATEIYGDGRERDDLRKTWLKVAAMVAVTGVLLGAAAYIALRYTEKTIEQQPAAARTTIDNPAPGASAAPQTEEIPAQPVQPPAAKSAEQQAGNAFEASLRSSASNTTTKAAFNSLFRLWGVQYDPDSPRACEYAEQFQLYCLFQKGSLAQVQKLDRPAILTLQDNQGGRHQVVLAQIENDMATVDIGGTEQRVPLSDLIELWDGEFLLLWKPQAGAEKSFFPGMRDPGVIWLRQSLAKIQGTPVEPMDSDLFDESLEGRVKQYQVTRRLTVDGMVGQQTLILINSDIDAAVPKLTRVN
ncbi:MAG: AAA family ATPase [Gammaproteobacteria bacterium]|jgi:general secretion pathway protein A